MNLYLCWKNMKMNGHCMTVWYILCQGWDWSACTHIFSKCSCVQPVSSNIGVLRVPLNSSGLRAWISFEVPAVHLHKADFASALLEVSNALKCSNPSPTFRQPFLTHSRVTVPVDCTGRKGHTHIHACVRVCVIDVRTHVCLQYNWQMCSLV